MTVKAPLTLYELAGADPRLRFSPHCWKVRLALAHKGLDVDGVPWRFTQKEEIAFSGQGAVPVLVDQGEAVSDSFRIACYLEDRYPDRPSLFGGEVGRGMARFVNSWADTGPMATIAPALMLTIFGRIAQEDRDYFRTSREKRFGKALEEVAGDVDARVAAFRQTLTPLRAMLQHQPFVCGDTHAYGDYAAFGVFMWIRCVSDLEVLEEADPVHAWRERMLNAFDGLARTAPTPKDCGLAA